MLVLAVIAATSMASLVTPWAWTGTFFCRSAPLTSVIVDLPGTVVTTGALLFVFDEPALPHPANASAAIRHPVMIPARIVLPGPWRLIFALTLTSHQRAHKAAS